MLSVLFFFMGKYNGIHTINKSKEMLKYLYMLNEGNYLYKDGFVFSENGSLLKEKYYFDGNGIINIDKYKNVRFKINSNNKCVSKTYLGNIEILDGKCKDFENIDVEIIRNNKIISFSSNKTNLEYMLSNSDDFKGNWIKQDYKDNIILNSYTVGNNYIWFKDKDGNISDVIEFKVDCLNSFKTEYNSELYYCSGSVVILDSIEWLVLDDTNNDITLMKYTPIDEKISHCLNEESEFCYYTKDSRVTHI